MLVNLKHFQDVISFEEFPFRLVRLALFFFLTEDLREADLSFEEVSELHTQEQDVHHTESSTQLLEFSNIETAHQMILQLVEVFFFADRYGLTDLIAQVVDLLEEECRC